MEVLCVDGKFTPDVLAFYSLHGVKVPIEEKIYTIRDHVKHTTGEIGLLLVEIINPKVPIKHPILGTIQMEPTWAIRRFRTLNGDDINEEFLKQIEELIEKR